MARATDPADDVDVDLLAERPRQFEVRWGVEFLEPPLTQASLGPLPPAIDA